MANLLHIELSEEEAGVLLQLIHIAVQAKGLDAAQAGVHFQQKINAAKKADTESDLEIVSDAGDLTK